MDLWDVDIGRSLWTWSSPPTLSKGCPGLCPDGFWVSQRMGAPEFLRKLCYYLITQSKNIFVMAFEMLHFVLIFPLWCYLYTLRFPQPFLLKADESQLPQTLLVGQIFPSLEYLCWAWSSMSLCLLLLGADNWVQLSRGVSALPRQARLASPDLLAVLFRIQTRILLGTFSSS